MNNSADSDLQWMQRAYALAQRAFDEGEVPVGAVLVRDGREIGCGYNKPIAANDPSAHAEVQALREAAQREQNYRLPGTTLYVTVEPCTMCFGALIHARVERLVFAAPEPRAGVISSQLGLHQQQFYNHRIHCEGGLMAEPCAELISRFFSLRRASVKAEKSGKT